MQVDMIDLLTDRRAVGAQNVDALRSETGAPDARSQPLCCTEQVRAEPGLKVCHLRSMRQGDHEQVTRRHRLNVHEAMHRWSRYTTLDAALPATMRQKMQSSMSHPSCSALFDWS